MNTSYDVNGWINTIERESQRASADATGNGTPTTAPTGPPATKAATAAVAVARGGNGRAPVIVQPNNPWLVDPLDLIPTPSPSSLSSSRPINNNADSVPSSSPRRSTSSVSTHPHPHPQPQPQAIVNDSVDSAAFAAILHRATQSVGGGSGRTSSAQPSLPSLDNRSSMHMSNRHSSSSGGVPSTGVVADKEQEREGKQITAIYDWHVLLLMLLYACVLNNSAKSVECVEQD